MAVFIGDNAVHRRGFQPIQLLCALALRSKLLEMSKVEEVKSLTAALSRAELLELQDWLQNVLEDEMELTESFKSQIEQSEREMAAGMRPRVRQP